jgi:hypothetical protein
MYAKIKICKSIGNILYYHEEKVKQGQAYCLYAGNFIKDLDRLTWSDKIYHFQRLSSLNERIRKPIVHVSLNFHPSDSLTDQKMREISREFMQKWGFSDQPWLAYRHIDSAHPHLHLVTTVVQTNGNKHLLEPRDFHRAKELTKQLEADWSLVPCIRWKQSQQPPIGPAQKIVYGQTQVYQAMRNVLHKVIDHYHYTSIEELNAVLRPYNFEAYGGRPGSVLRAHRGLLYRVLDENGRSVGSTVKAGQFDNKPTLKNLEKRFIQNQALRELHRQHLTTAIDWTFYKKSPSLETFRMALKKEQIDTILQKNEKGDFQNIWYVDHLRKTVFDGKTLGSSYTVDAISKKCEAREDHEQKQIQTEKQQLKVRPRLDHF